MGNEGIGIHARYFDTAFLFTPPLSAESAPHIHVGQQGKPYFLPAPLLYVTENFQI